MTDLSIFVCIIVPPLFIFFCRMNKSGLAGSGITGERGGAWVAVRTSEVGIYKRKHTIDQV